MGEADTGWTRHGERLVYDHRWVRVGLVDVERPGGWREDYHVVHLDPVAVALVVDEHQRVLMLWRYRFPVDQWGYELPGGLVEPGETAAAAADRETLEETGWRAARHAGAPGAV
jgi:ADP-ribose pyrophosphatase